MNSANLPLPDYSIKGFFIVDFMRNSYLEKEIEVVDNHPNSYPNLTDVQLKILEIIKGNPSISVPELNRKIDDITIDGIKWNIKQLKSKNILKREGNTRKGYWKINK